MKSFVRMHALTCVVMFTLTQYAHSAESVVEARFTGTIHWIEPIGRREAEIAAAETDARWLVAIEITSIEKAGARFDKPGKVVLAIHSPVKLLARSGESASGKAYSFQIAGEVQGNSTVYHWVRAHELAL
jgi:hypothetical protein